MELSADQRANVEYMMAFGVERNMAEFLASEWTAQVSHWSVPLTVEALKKRGWRIVKLQVDDTDPSGPEWTSYYIEAEL